MALVYPRNALPMLARTQPIGSHHFDATALITILPQSGEEMIIIREYSTCCYRVMLA
jgi:hypothetical protein